MPSKHGFSTQMLYTSYTQSQKSASFPVTHGLKGVPISLIDIFFLFTKIYITLLFFFCYFFVKLADISLVTKCNECHHRIRRKKFKSITQKFSSL